MSERKPSPCTAADCNPQPQVEGRKIQTVGSITETDSSLVLEGKRVFDDSPQRFANSANNTLSASFKQ